jgi:hypothetical protein
MTYHFLAPVAIKVFQMKQTLKKNKKKCNNKVPKNNKISISAKASLQNLTEQSTSRP